MNRGVGTAHEKILQRELKHLGLDFRKNVRGLPGKPDIVFPKAKTAIFCDGDFWHGKDWRLLKRNLRKGTNASYWIAKIASNVHRDRLNTRLLRRLGWQVLRFWESEVREDAKAVAVRVRSAVVGVGRRRK